MKKLTQKIISLITVAAMVVTTVVCIGTEIAEAATFTTGSRFSGVGYGTYYHNADKFDPNAMMQGVDVSEYQSGAKSDWNVAKANGVDFAIARVTWTGYGSAGSKNLDDNFKNHFFKAKAAGVLVGAYVFSQAKNESEAIAEADYAVARLQALGIQPWDMDLPVYMDYEYAGSSGSGSNHGRLYDSTKSKRTAAAVAFCERIRSYGYTPGIYACTSFLNSAVDGASLAQKYDMWVAQYYNKCEFYGNYNMWQYSSSAKIPGINNKNGSTMSVDVNFWYMNTDSIMTDSGTMANVTVEFNDGTSEFRCNGSALTPKFTVKAGDVPLTEGVDYTVKYFNNVNVGSARIQLRGINSQNGYKNVEFTIKPALDHLGLAEVPRLTAERKAAAEKAKIKEAEEQTAELTEETAEENAELENEKTAEAIIVEEAEKAVGIADENAELTEENTEPVEENAELQEEEQQEEEELVISDEPVLVLTDQAISAGYTLDNDYVSGVIGGTTVGALKQAIGLSEYYKSEGLVLRFEDPNTGRELGDGEGIYTGAQIGVYNGEGFGLENRWGDVIVNVNGSVAIYPSCGTFYYDGGYKTTGATVYMNNLCVAQDLNGDNGLMVVSSGYGKGLGSYGITVTGRGMFTGTWGSGFSIVVCPTSLKSLSAKKKGFKAKWYKQAKANVTGYQIQYSKKSDMSSSSKKTISKYKTTSKSVGGRTRKKVYYVRVRTYKKIGKTKYYSAWSDIWTVKTK